MFKNLGSDAIDYGMGVIGDLNAGYNSWGANAAPVQYPYPSYEIYGADPNPFTFVELEVTPSGALSDSQVAVGDTISFTVTADLTEVIGADFVLKYPTDLLTLVGVSDETALFQ